MAIVTFWFSTWVWGRVRAEAVAAARSDLQLHAVKDSGREVDGDGGVLGL